MMGVRRMARASSSSCVLVTALLAAPAMIDMAPRVFFYLSGWCVLRPGGKPME